MPRDGPNLVRVFMFLKGMCYAESETTTFKDKRPQTPNAL